MSKHDSARDVAMKARALIEAAGKVPPQQRWDIMVASGLIDRDGRVLPNRPIPKQPPDADLARERDEAVALLEAFDRWTLDVQANKNFDPVRIRAVVRNTRAFLARVKPTEDP